MIKLTCLGSGNAFNHIQGNTSFILDSDSYRLMIDCGPLATRALALNPSLKRTSKDANERALEVNGIILTHLHGDHIHGLEEMGWRNYFLGNKSTLCLPNKEMSKTLWDNCLSGTMGFISNTIGATIKTSLDSFFNVIEENTIILNEGEIIVSFIPVKHVPGNPSFSVMVTLPKHIIWFSGDCVYDKNLETYFDSCDIILHEVDTYISQSHTSLNSLNESSFKNKMLLCHYPEQENLEMFDKEIKSMGFKGIVGPGTEIILND